tara:strand:+ start:1121 stop:8908 length:7788 start_codon:yes stop_codon:yes gene_type:complete
MKKYHKYVKQAPTNLDFDYPRGSPVDESMFDILTNDSSEQVPLEFGRSPKDIIEFSVYTPDNEVLQSRIVERDDSFVERKYDFTDYNGERRIGSINTFDRNYQLSEAGDVIISPTHELRELGYVDGTHRVGVSFRNDIVGSAESTSKLMITDISPSRMELKLVPSGLKTTKKPLEVLLNFEYDNFFNKRLLVAHVYNETFKFIKGAGVEAYINRVIADNEIEFYHESILEIVELFGMDSRQDFVKECVEFQEQVNSLYFNIMLWKYNDVFAENDFAKEYVLCVDRVLDISSRFANRSRDESLINPHDTYRKTLLAQYDSDRVSKIYNAKFTSYFTNVLNFADGTIVPFVNVVRGTENAEDTRKHRPLVIKLIDPLSTDVVVGNKLHISNVAYSDDIIQTTVLYKRTKPAMYKMRGPNLSFTSGGGSSQYTLDKLENAKHERNRNALLDSTDELTEPLRERLADIEQEWRAELYGTPLEISEEIARYFQSNIEEKYLTVDYSDFSKFVRYSSARKRLDVFIYKLAKISEFDRQMERIRRSWRLSTPEKFNRMSYDTQMQTLRIEKNKMLNGFDGYERFLYFEDIVQLSETATTLQEEIDDIRRAVARRGETPQDIEKIAELERQLTYVYVSWPRQDFECDNIDEWSELITDYVYGEAVMYEDSIWIVSENATPTPTDIPGTSNAWQFFCKCGECVGKKIPMTTASYTFLSARTYYRPEPIPPTMEEFSKSSAYSWYSLKAKEADFYDKHNDNSLLSNTPEFITRQETNSDYFDFLSFIGHQFDLIHLYVDGIGSIKQPLNNPDKGIPNEMVSHMLNYFGGGFVGYDDGEVNALMNQVTTKEHIEFINKFKDRKNIIWRRILNNLPQMLKAIGTEQSVRIMFRCYGVPDYLFRIREFGGVEYNTDLSDEAVYSFDTFDYYLKLSEENQYVEVDWGNPAYEINSLEFRFGFNADVIDVKNNPHIVVASSPGRWEFGYEPVNDNVEKVYGRFYFAIYKGTELYKKSYFKDTSTGSQWVHPFENSRYDILIRRHSGEDDSDRRGLQLYAKRVEQYEVVYNSYAEMSTDDHDYKMFYDGSSTSTVVFGNYNYSNFIGRLDRFRIYNHVLSERRFENHILFNQSYDTDDPTKIDETLIFKANFDFPYDLRSSDDNNYGIIENTAFRKDVPKVARCYNFIKDEYPFDFAGSPVRHYAKLPSYGSQVFNNNKIRLETQELITQLSVSDRSTLKSNDRLTADTNTVGVYFSSSDLINHEIIRFFGDFKLGDYIGTPEDLYEGVYGEFKKLRHTFYRHGFGKLDFSTYLNIVESYVDPSLFDNIKKLVPARSRLISGLVVEPTLLERPKIKRRPIQNEIVRLDDVNFNLKPDCSNLVSPGNRRSYITDNDQQEITGYDFNAIHTSRISNWYPSEFNMNSVKDIPNELMYGVSSYQGVSAGYKIEALSPTHSRYNMSMDSRNIYGAIKLSGTIVAGSSFNCVMFGRLGSAIKTNPGIEKFTGWIHRDTTINGERPMISGGYDVNGYAEFSYVFNGHRVIGKLHGDYVGQIQEGVIAKFQILGKFGGRVYDECTSEYISGSIARDLIEVSKFNKSANMTGYDNRTSVRVIESTFKDGDVNAVEIPETIQKKVPVEIEYDTKYKLQNIDSGISRVSGEYTGILSVDVSAIFVPPVIVTYLVTWERGIIESNASGERTFNTTETLLNINRSTYDYVHNIKRTEYDVNSMIPADKIKLKPKYVSDDTVDRRTEHENILNSLKNSACDPTKIAEYMSTLETLENVTLRYELTGDAYVNGYDGSTFYVSVKPPVHLSVGDRVYMQDVTMHYDNCNYADSYINFNDTYYTITKITHNDSTGNVDIEFPHGKTDFSTSCGGTYSHGGSIGLVPDTSTSERNVYDIGKYEMYYEYDIPFNFVQKLRTPVIDSNRDGIYDTLREDIPLSISVENGNFHATWVDGNQVNSSGDTATGEIKLGFSDETDGNGGKKESTSEWYFGNDIKTEDGLPSETCNDIYRLKIEVCVHKQDHVVTKPMIIDDDIGVGDVVEIVFRKGSYLWHPDVKGLEMITGHVTSLTTDANSNTTLSIKNSANELNTFQLNATHIYSVRIITSSRTSTAKEIPFSDTYSETLRGTSPDEQRYYPDKDSVELPIKLKSSTYVVVEKPYEFYNIVDIGNPMFKIWDGTFPQYKGNHRNVFSQASKRRGDIYCRRSVSSVNTTISDDTGTPNQTPPIVRTRKTGIQDSIGDSFWYLDDNPISDLVGCGIVGHSLQQITPSPCDPPITSTTASQNETVDTTTQDPFDLDSLMLHYTFESDDTTSTIVDSSGNERTGILHNSILRDGGVSRRYRNVLELDNDVRTDSDNTNSYLQVTGTPFTANALTISFWIRPIGVSGDNVGIVLNNSEEPNSRHGIILNPNGNQYALGYVWNDNLNSHSVDLGANLTHDTWSYVVILMYPGGFVRTFINNWFISNYDLGVNHPSVSFDKLEIGRFSGMVDDVRIYDEILDYGDVALSKQASGMVESLYKSTRNNQPRTERDAEFCELDHYNFRYYQQPDFVLANSMYELHPGSEPVSDPEVDAKRKFKIRGGVNDGRNRNATTEFMGRICGSLKEIS